MFLEDVGNSFQVFDESTDVSHVRRLLPLERIDDGSDENHGAARPDVDVLPVEILVDSLRLSRVVHRPPVRRR